MLKLYRILQSSPAGLDLQTEEILQTVPQLMSRGQSLGKSHDLLFIRARIANAGFAVRSGKPRTMFNWSVCAGPEIPWDLHNMNRFSAKLEDKDNMKYPKLRPKCSVPDPLIPQNIIQGVSGLKKSKEISMCRSHLAPPDSSWEQSCPVNSS